MLCPPRHVGMMMRKVAQRVGMMVCKVAMSPAVRVGMMVHEVACVRLLRLMVREAEVTPASSGLDGA